MECPNRKCRRATDRLVVKVDKHGKVFEGCYTCLPRLMEPHVYTGKKIWTGEQAYGKEKNAEKNYEYGLKIARRAAHMRRTNPFREGKD